MTEPVIRKSAFYVGLTVIVLVLLYRLETVILLTFLAIIIATLLDAIAGLGMRWMRMPRGVAVVTAAGVLVLGGGLTLLLLAVPVAQQGSAFIQSLPQESKKLSQKIEKLGKEYPWLSHLLPSLEQKQQPQDKPKATEVAKQAVLTAGAAIDWSGHALAMFFLALFLAWDPARWLRGMAQLIPGGNVQEHITLLRKLGGALRSYLFTIGLYILAMAALWTLGLWIIGVDYALVFGVIGGVVEVVPYIGPLVGLVPPLFYALATAPVKAIWVVVLYVVLHIVEGYVLVPYLMQEQENLPAPLIVLSIIVCGTLFGILGVVLAVPLATVLYVFLNETVYRSDKDSARAKSA